MATPRLVAVVGARSLPASWAPRVASIGSWLLGRGFGITSGGAVGADCSALAAVVRAGRDACARSVIFLPGAVDDAPRPCVGLLRRFVALGGNVVPGSLRRPVTRAQAVLALWDRTAAMVDASCGLVAFLSGPSRGSLRTIRLAIRRGLPVVAFVADGAMLPVCPGGRWVAVDSGPLAGAFRWVPDPPEAESALRPLQEIVTVPSTTGMPVEDTMAHVSSLSQGDRLWFERCEVVGDKIVAPHENVSDGRPSFLSVPALRKRFGCDAATAVELGELFFALDADETVVGYYAGEAHHWGLDAIRQDLFRLVVGLTELEQHDDPVDAAEAYREEDEAEDELPTSPSVGYHVVGSLFGDDGEPDWVARQPQWFRALLTRIDGCPSLEALAALGQELYTMPLAHEQAGVAWTWYRLRKARLEQTTRLSPPAWRLLQQIETASLHHLPRLGTRLYRLQHNGLGSLPSHEWAVLWRVYHEKRATVS